MNTSLFARTELLPPDSNIGLTEEFRRDARTNKINLSVGTYCDAAGRIPLLRAVRVAEERLVALGRPRDYQPIEGSSAFTAAAQRLLFGDASPQVLDGQVVTVQALGGTGALRLAAAYLQRIFPNSTAYTSQQTWDNHRQIFAEAGFKVGDYPYYDHVAKRVDFDALMGFLNGLPPESIVILHACCHNPSGADLTQQQWRDIATVAQSRRLVPLLDMAYQGFGVGVKEDAYAVGLFADLGLNFLVAHSFSKSFSFYGERVGALSVVAGSADEGHRALSNLKRIVRTMYSNPPTHGGAVVAEILNDPVLFKSWEDELLVIRGRIRDMRGQFVELLGKAGLDYGFVRSQQGMFSFAGLTIDQVEQLKSEHAIYALRSGRICLAALNDQNVGYVANALAAVVNP